MNVKFIKKLKQILSVFLTVAFLSTSVLGGIRVNAESDTSAGIIDKFKTPDVDAKPMARMWFPDAGAGASEEGLAMVAKQINEMAEGGFGGVEIAFLSDDTKYDNDYAKEIGWGSENWKRVLKQILTTANAVEDGFKIDITITTHWPPVVNNIDPNDDEAAKEASYSYQKITNEDLENGIMDLPLPEQKTKDYFSPFGGGDSAKADFLFEDKYTAATIARVASIEDGSPAFEFSTLEDVSDYTAEKTVTGAVYEDVYNAVEGSMDNEYYVGYPIGIPDEEYCNENGIDYDDIISKFGPDPESENFEGKIDSDGNRKRMADWQYLYETNLDSIDILDDYVASNGDDLAVGDYVIFGNYFRGTGQVLSGGASVPEYNRCYASDYFSDIGVQKVFDFWDDNILDSEMISLLEENGSKNGTSIFEDSIEIHKSSPVWTYDLLEEFSDFNEYDAAKYAPLLASGSSSLFDEESEAERIIEDYNLVLGDLYATEHAAKISEWASTFNYTYRAQGYTLTGLDVCGAALALDVPEGDNSTAGDGIRQLASAVNMKGSKMLSMESTTFTANIFSVWEDVVKELNEDFSHGINRSILHGSAFARTFNGYLSAWPGWNFFKSMLNGGGFSSWNARQIYWDDVDTASGYMARTQAVMQNGKAKVDLAVLLGTDEGFNNQSGNSLQTLLNNGYSYNVMSEPVLMLDNAVVEDGVLAPDGPSYKALIIKDATKMSSTAMQKVLEYAVGGLPVIFYNSEISRVYGTNKDDNNDDIMEYILQVLMSKENVSTASTEEEIMEILEGDDIAPAASYTQTGLETSHRISDEGTYYYFYNENEEEDTTSEDVNSDSSINTTVTLEGEGIPYILNAWTGEITPIAEYTKSNGKITFDIDLDSREAKIVGIIEDTTEFPSASTSHVVDLTGGEVVYDGGTVVHRADTAGTYTATLSDDTEKVIEVSNIPDSISISDGWDLTLESWGPIESADEISIDNNTGYELDPTLSEKISTDFEDISLTDWGDLEATEEQISELGVTDMNEVSGIGYYSTTFEIPDTWTSDIGAYMKFGHNSDMVVEVNINANIIDDIDQFANTTDVGNYLKNGTNTLEVKLDSTLQNRASTSGNTTYGLTSVELIPYSETDMGISAEDETDDNFTVSTTYTIGSTANTSVLVANNLLDANSVITNNGTESKDVLLIVALYDSAGTMVNVSYLSKIVEVKASENFHAGFKLPADITGYKAKAFVWDGESIASSPMTPLSNTTEITD